MVVDQNWEVTMTSRKKPVSLAIHYGLLTAADKLLIAAKELERQGDEASLSQCRACCASALFVACSALEGCMNVFAGIFYENHGREHAEADEWTPDPRHCGRMKWHNHKTVRKWTRYAPKFVGGTLTGEGLERWEERLEVLAAARDHLFAHFKGAWGPADLEAAYQALAVDETVRYVDMARALIGALHRSYEAVHRVRISYGGKDGPILPRQRTALDQPWSVLTEGPIPTAGDVFEVRADGSVVRRAGARGHDQ